MGLVGGLSALSGMFRGALLGASVLAIFAAGMAVDRALPVIGANAEHAHALAWKANAGLWTTYGRAEHAAFAQSEALRAQERAQAVSAATSAAVACDGRMSRLRASEAAISRVMAPAVVQESWRTGPLSCPAPGLIGADDLRAVITQKP